MIGFKNFYNILFLKLLLINSFYVFFFKYFIKIKNNQQFFNKNIS